MGRKQDSFRQDLVSFISIILRSLVIFAEQFFSALISGPGNGGLTFAPLPDADAEMWAGDLFLTVLSFGVAGLPAQGLATVAGCSAEHSCSKWRRKPERPPRRAQLHRANGV